MASEGRSVARGRSASRGRSVSRGRSASRAKAGPARTNQLLDGILSVNAGRDVRGAKHYESLARIRQAFLEDLPNYEWFTKRMSGRAKALMRSLRMKPPARLYEFVGLENGFRDVQEVVASAIRDEPRGWNEFVRLMMIANAAR